MFGNEVSEKQKAVDAVPFWWHSIDVGDGILTKGKVKAEYLDRVWRSMELPDLHGKSVLDVGAWDGYFSFKAEERGANVTALDYFSWSIDFSKENGFKDYQEMISKIDLRKLPGMVGFETVRNLKDSKVVAAVGDFEKADEKFLGQFDITLFLGVLYHMKNPLGALTTLASITKEFSIIETAEIAVKENDDSALLEFYEGRDLGCDPTNFFAPNFIALVKMCREAGFKNVVKLAEGNHEPVRDGLLRCRIMVRAEK
jgi:tRNA (mo5U34)-methyltransferase